jgi:hypothetical protein
MTGDEFMIESGPFVGDQDQLQRVPIAAALYPNATFLGTSVRTKGDCNVVFWCTYQTLNPCPTFG